MRISLEAAAKRLVRFAFRAIFFLCFMSLLSATQGNAQFPLHRKKKVNKSTSADNQAAPDKVLYDRALEDIKHGRHEIGRLNLQTLINTYPDSEYLAKAKLSIADSYYKEGGTANLTQAVQGYKDFIVFFPFLPEAAYAQMQVAMTQFKQMDKPDRDRLHAREAEAEFQTFLQKYPNDPLRPKAEQHLREVQEVLAEGDFRIGYFYFVKGDRRAAAGRLLTVTSRYPLYSHSDRALWMLADIFEKSEKKEIAGRYYARIVRDYPLSSLVGDAKARLTQLKAPVPQADPKAVAWMTAEQNAPRPKTSLFLKPVGMFRGGPTGEVRAAARHGEPNLTQEEESMGDILSGGDKTHTIGSSIVTTAMPGVSTGATAENTGSATDTAAKPEAELTAPEKQSDAGTNPSGSATDGANASGSGSTTNGSSANTNADAAQPDKTQPEASAGRQQNGDSKNSKADPKKESSSKKKKGLKKIVPW